MVTDPVAAAEKVTTRAQAEKLYKRLEADLDQRDDLPPGWREQAEQALHTLLSRHMDKPAPKPVLRRPTSHKRPRGRRTSPPKRPGDRRTTRPAGRRPGRRGTRRALEQTGIPAAGRSATAFGLQLVGLMVGLAILYRVLINAQSKPVGKNVVDLTFGSLTAAVRTLIDPRVDPLAPHAINRAGVDVTTEAIATGDLNPNNVVPIRAPAYKPPQTTAAAHSGPYATN